MISDKLFIPSDSIRFEKLFANQALESVADMMGLDPP